MSWFSKYTFTASHPTAGDRVVSPDIPGLRTLDRPSSAGRFTLRELATEFAFYGGDYTYFKGIEEDVSQRCETLSFTIKSNCGGVEITHFEGKINLHEAEFEPRLCRMFVTPEPDNAYTCFLDEYDIEYNILDVATKYTVKPLLGDVKFRSAGTESQSSIQPNLISIGAGVNNTDPLGGTFDPADGWVIYWNQIGGLVETSPGLYDGDVITYWAREEAVGYGGTAPPGQGWIDLGGGDWARPVQTYLNEFSPGLVYNGAGVLTGREEIYEIVGLNIPTPVSDPFDAPENLSELEYDNAVDLGDAIEYLLVQMDCGVAAVRSDFYRINSTSSPAYDPYGQVRSDFDKIFLWDKSDIRTPLVSNNATESKVSLQDILENLKATHNVDWRIETISSQPTLIIEHETYFDKANGIDLLSGYADQVANKTAYSYASNEIPRKEEFNWQEKSSLFFNGNPIRYSSACAAGDPKTYSADRFFTDLGYMEQNTDSVSNEGLFVGAAYLDDGAYYFQKGGNGFNDALAYRNLHPRYWVYGRPYIEGMVNNISTVFESSIRIKEQEQIIISMPLTTYGQDFDGGELQNTEFGWGEVLSAEYDHVSNLLTLNLRHDS